MSHPPLCKTRPQVVILSLMLSLLVPLRLSRAGQPETSRSATTEMHGAEEEQVSFADGSTILAGTLFRPAASVDYPALAVLAGADRSARGELRMTIASYLAAHGIAALVYDSPGTGASTGNALLQSSADRVAEALSAVAYLQAQPGIRPTAVGLFGGSEGANIALMAGAKDSRVAFVIPVSSSLGVSVLDILRYSAEKKGAAQGLTLDEIAQATTFKEVAFVLLSGVELAEWPLIESRAEQWDDAPWPTLCDLARQRCKGMRQEQKEAFLDSLRVIVPRFSTQRWFEVVDVGHAVQRMLSLDANTLFSLLDSGRYSRDWDRSLCIGDEGLHGPVLAIWGEEDSFLPPRQSAARLGKYLADSNHPDYDVIIYPNANHFLTQPGSKSEFVPGYLDTMVNWVGKRFGPEARAQPRRSNEGTP